MMMALALAEANGNCLLQEYLDKKAEELMVSAPAIQPMFLDFNNLYFGNKIPSVDVSWCEKLGVTAGKTYFDSCNVNDPTVKEIKLSSKLFKNNQWNLRYIAETLIHEMVHAFLIIFYRDSSHGARFQKMMKNILGEERDYTKHEFNTVGMADEKTVIAICENCGEIERGFNTPENFGKADFFHADCMGRIRFEDSRAQELLKHFAFNF